MFLHAFAGSGWVYCGYTAGMSNFLASMAERVSARFSAREEEEEEEEDTRPMPTPGPPALGASGPLPFIQVSLIPGSVPG